MVMGDGNLWGGAYKIPWDDPDFSRRMLQEHLSQDHDLASRRVEWIDRQVAWIHDELLAGRPSRILDLGCGPGLYSHRLTQRGHQCRGIDFGPASIAYAQQHNPDPQRCEFALGDVRRGAFGGPYDLALFLFGEFNVFSPDEASTILRHIAASLRPDGCLAVEMQTPTAVAQIGDAAPSEQQVDRGLFADGPYHCRTQNLWLAAQQVAVQVFQVAEAGDRPPRTYRSTTQAWSDDALHALVAQAGFQHFQRRPDWPCNTTSLELWVGVRP